MKVGPTGGDRQTGQAYTFDGEYPIVKVGKMNPRETRIDIVYTEETADAYEVARAQFEAAGGGSMYARWSPAGGGIGDARYQTDAGFVKDFSYPEVDSEATGPMRAWFIIQHSRITTSTITST